MENGAAEGEALAPAAGKIARERRFAPVQAGHVEDELPPCRQPLAGEAVDSAEELDVLVDRQQLVERELLRHVADAAFDAFRILRDVDAADERGAAGRPQQAAQHADGGGLARAVGAQEAEDLARLDAEGQVVHGDEVTEAAGKPTHVRSAAMAVRAVPARAAKARLGAAVTPGERAQSRASSARIRSCSCATSTSVVVATPTTKRSPSTRLASVAARTPASAARTAAWLERRSRTRWRTSADTTVSRSFWRSSTARAAAAASATSARVRPLSKNVQLTLKPMSQDDCQTSSRGKILGFGFAKS